MSGGSMNYFYSTLNDYAPCLIDKELIDLAHDMADLFYAREWYDSGDTDKGDWNEAVLKFKTKWFMESRNDRLETYITKTVNELRKDLGLRAYCKDCEHFTPRPNSPYGDCKFSPRLEHHYNDTCEHFDHK